MDRKGEFLSESVSDMNFRIGSIWYSKT